MTTARADGALDLARDTADALRRLIVAGRLAPGVTLVEREIARRLDVSRGTVRAALQTLVQEGHAVSTTIDRYARISVAALTVDDARDIWQVMSALDATAAAAAAALPADVRSELVEGLDGANAALAAASRSARRSANKAYDLDAAFHGRYVDAATGPRLQSQVRVMQPQLARYARLYSADLSGQSATEHEPIIAAIDAGKPDAARRASSIHWERSLQRVVMLITKSGELGAW